MMEFASKLDPYQCGDTRPISERPPTKPALLGSEEDRLS